jgi:signal transduction histidine kinase
LNLDVGARADIKTQAVTPDGTGERKSVQEYLSQLGETAQQALKEMRLLVYQLRPSTLDQEGLARALRQRLDTVERRAGIEARLLIEDSLDLPKQVEEGLYRIAQEALNNALKHAAAGAVVVEIRSDGEFVRLDVTDNGCGFDPESAGDTGGVGLSSMRERAEELGGTFQIVTEPGKGTNVQVQVRLR